MAYTPCQKRERMKSHWFFFCSLEIFPFVSACRNLYRVTVGGSITSERWLSYVVSADCNQHARGIERERNKKRTTTYENFVDQLLLVEQDDLAVKAGHFIAEAIHSHGGAGFLLRLPFWEARQKIQNKAREYNKPFSLFFLSSFVFFFSSSSFFFRIKSREFGSTLTIVYNNG